MLRTSAGTTKTAAAAAVTASCSGAPPALLRLRPPRFGVRLARRQQQQQHGKNRFGIAVRSSEPDATFEELQEQAEEFMRKQSAIETGEEDVSVSYDNTLEFGSDEVTDEDVEVYTRECLDLIGMLSKNRDMTLNEVKLILAIEDPRAQEARRVYGVENESGVSRDEIAECLIDVAERRKVNNRIALRELRKELAAWPGLLKSSEDAGGDEAESDGDLQATSGDLAKPAANPQIGRGEEDESGLPKALADYLPDWMGYGVLYSLSIVPILITLGALAILWVNSFSN